MVGRGFAELHATLSFRKTVPHPSAHVGIFHRLAWAVAGLHRSGNQLRFDGPSAVTSRSTTEAGTPLLDQSVNLGATSPGRFPGELSPTKQDYSRWFQQMKDMNARLVRVYTIMTPGILPGFAEFNANQSQPLWLMQASGPRMKSLPGPDGLGATTPSTPVHRPGVFTSEIARRGAGGAWRHCPASELRPWQRDLQCGRITLPARLAGREPNGIPYTVKVTNDSHPKSAPFPGPTFGQLFRPPRLKAGWR